MGTRRKGREHALRLLYQRDQAAVDLDECLATYWAGENQKEPIREFTERIVRGVEETRDEIDELISRQTHHWKIDRIAAVDRNIFRLAVFEFLHEGDTPRAVVINEALEIAKRYSTEASSQFLNGVLDGIRKMLDGEDATPPPAPESVPGENHSGEGV